MLNVKFPFKNDGYTRHKLVNLLLFTNEENSHYMVIKNISRLLALDNSDDHKCYECLNCLQLFKSTESRDQHFDYWIDNEAIKIEILKPGSMVKFQDGLKQMRVPFEIYVDTETLQK